MKSSRCKTAGCENAPCRFPLAGDQGKNLLGKSNDNTACHGEHAVGALGGIVALEGQAHLQDTEAQQDEADAQIKEKIKSLKLLTTASGSSAASAGIAVAIITMAVQARTA